MRVGPLILALAGVAALLPAAAAAEDIHVAVASNFSRTLRDIATRFGKRSGDRVILVTGSTGSLYAQIRNGAPVDAFFAADGERPRRLEEQGLIQPGSRFSYALGRLVLWSPRDGLVDDAGKVLRQGRFRHLAIANPRLAPYGKAAREVLQHLDLWEELVPRLIRGENINQAFQFVRGGHAELGFVALSQLAHAKLPSGSRWLPPASLYSPIEQQAVQLTAVDTATDFLAFTRSDEIRALIRAQGYELP